MTDDAPPSDLARALGRVPSGLFVLATRGGDGTPIGFLASFVQQVAFDPPTICVAFGRDRDHLALVRANGRFAVSVLPSGAPTLMRPFFGKHEEGVSPFDALDTLASPSGQPVLADAVAWLDCRVSGEHDAGDHVVVFGVVEAGERRNDRAPATHVRRNGFGY